MSENEAALTTEQALALLPDKERIHTFRSTLGPGSSILLGADWDRETLEELIANSRCELAGPMATGMGYGLVVFDEIGPLFVEIRKEETAE